MLASVVAYGVNGLIVGWQPLFHFPPSVIPLRTITLRLVRWCQVAPVVLSPPCSPVVFYQLRDAFRALPFPAAMNPAIGGIGVGLLALKFPQILGGGYGWIQEAIRDGHIVLSVSLVLIFLKIIAFALTVSSGGSGGVFAPTLFVGAMLGGFMSSSLHLPSATFVIVAWLQFLGRPPEFPLRHW